MIKKKRVYISIKTIKKKLRSLLITITYMLNGVAKISWFDATTLFFSLGDIKELNLYSSITIKIKGILAVYEH